MNIITIVHNTNALGWTVTLTRGRRRKEQHSGLGNAGNAAAKAVQLSQFVKDCKIVGDDNAMRIINDSLKRV